MDNDSLSQLPFYSVLPSPQSSEYLVGGSLSGSPSGSPRLPISPILNTISMANTNTTDITSRAPLYTLVLLGTNYRELDPNKPITPPRTEKLDLKNYRP